MTVIPGDITPYIQGYPIVSTRRIFGQWIYTDGTGVEVPPTITYIGGPYYINSTKITVFPKQQVAVTLAPTTEGTTGLWYADVVVSDDPDLVGDVSIRVSHPILPGGSITVVVPAGAEPLNIANAARVVGTPGGLPTTLPNVFTSKMKVYVSLKQNSDGSYDVRPTDLASYQAIEWIGTTKSPYALPGDKWAQTSVIPV